MTNEFYGMILSLIGMAITTASFQARKRRMYLLLQSIGSAFYLVSYIFSDGGVAVWLNVIYLIRNIIYMFVERVSRTGQKRICFGLCVAYTLTYILFFLFGGQSLSDHLWGVLCIIGSYFGTAAVLYADPVKLRIVKLGDIFFWTIFHVHLGLGALGGILGGVIDCSSNLIAISRFRKEKV